MVLLRLLLILSFAAFPVGSAVADANLHAETWEFVATLNGKEIGNHVFKLSKDPSYAEGWRLSSEATFTATFVGVPVYHYHHTAKEGWNDNCLSTLSADTDDDGEISSVHAEGSDNGGRLHAQAAKNNDVPVDSSWNGCLMTFAYWNPAMLKQTRLLNPQTGDIEDVSITQQPPETVTVRGNEVQAQVWRVAGKHEPVDVLYAPDGEWIGLNATLDGGNALAYRLP